MSGCASAPPATGLVQPAHVAARYAAVGWEGDALWVAVEADDGKCRLLRVGEDGRPAGRSEAPCPDWIEITLEGDLLLGSQGGGRVHDREGALIADAVLAWQSRQSFIAAVNDDVRWKTAGQEILVPEVGDIVAVALLPGGDEALAVRRGEEADELVRVRMDPLGQTKLSSLEGRFAGWDLAPDGEEAVVIVNREGTLDAAIVSATRPALNWIPGEGLPQTMPRWAPRGYKVSFIVEGYRDAIRSVHVPTAATQHVAPGTSIGSYDWHQDGERIAVITRSLLSGDAVEIYSFRGEHVRTALEPESRFEGEAVVLSDGKSVLVQPRAIRYGQRYSVVIVESPDRFDAELSALANSKDIGIVFSDDAESAIESIREIAWIDSEAIILYFSGSCDELSRQIPDEVSRVIDSIGRDCRLGVRIGTSGTDALSNAVRGRDER
ncbi:MAG: hypothetical protein KY459_04510 [Acidobacteria bacterium]|nr:hypothetical protein [Acidobacteriota bacterium]